MINLQNCQPCAFQCPLRVLVVDDDGSIRNELTDLLTAWNCEPVIAEGEDQQLIDDAVAKSNLGRCQVALVDLALRPGDTDTSPGENLIPLLKPTICIVFTGYPNPDVFRRTMIDRGAFTVISKHEDEDVIHDWIGRAFQRFCPGTLTLEWDPRLNTQAILHELRLDANFLSEQELNCILLRLFQDENSKLKGIAIESLAQYYKSQPSALPMLRSAVFVARAWEEEHENDRRWHQAEIIKLSKQQHILKEIENYEKYIKPHLPPQRCARIERWNALWEIGAVRYTNLSEEHQVPLRQGYTLLSEDDFKSCLEDLFSHTLKWEGVADQAKSYDFVYDYFTRVFEKLESRINQSDNIEAETIQFDGLPQLTNPIHYVRKFRQESRFFTRWKAYTHGDLHSQNIFINQHSKQSAVIDFERSGEGYYMRDFVELEADIRLRLLPLEPGDLQKIFCLDQILLSPKYSSDELRFASLPRMHQRMPGMPELRKAFEGIATLRKHARLSGLRDMREYYWALLMETMFSVVRDYSQYDAVASRFARDRAVLSAALICERLMRWDEKWPPEDWGRFV